jgi:DNA gyrase subunit B
MNELSAHRRQRVIDVAAGRLHGITVVMENIVDNHNASAVLRSCEGLGVEALHVVEQPNKWEKNKAIARSADDWVTIHKHQGLARCLGDLAAAGFDLYAVEGRTALNESLRFRPRFDELSARLGDPRITEALLLAGLSTDPEWRSEEIEAIADRVKSKLASQAPNGTTWSVEGKTLIENTFGVIRRFPLADDLLSWPELTAVAQNLTWVRESFADGAVFIADGTEKQLKGPLDLIAIVDARGRKGLSIQRFKGLGEMNAEDLWKTTLDPDNRKLTRVTMDSLAEMDSIISTAMGDNVEQRRAWIVEKGPSLKDVDLH